MENIIKSITNMHKNFEATDVLQSVSSSFEVFKNEFISITKEVDRKDDYYFAGDVITFTIRLTNKGKKNIVGFTLRDDLPTHIDPMPSGYYEVISPQGDISFTLDEIVISSISLAPGEELEINITGIVRELNKEMDSDDITF